jgi:hypothetical protein
LYVVQLHATLHSNCATLPARSKKQPAGTCNHVIGFMMTRAKVANEVDGIQVYRVLEGSGGGTPPHPTPPTRNSPQNLDCRANSQILGNYAKKMIFYCKMLGFFSPNFVILIGITPLRSPKIDPMHIYAVDHT